MSTSQRTERKWIDTRDAVVLAMFSVLSFLIETTLGLILYAFSAIPLAGGMVSGIFDAILIFLGVFLVPRRGAALLFSLLLLTMSTVTPSFGPPGLYKVAIGVGLGAAIEVVLMIVGRSIKAYVFATGLAFALSIPMTFWAWQWFGIPGASELRKMLLTFTGVYFAIGCVGATIGAGIYRGRLQKHKMILDLREGINASSVAEE